jgi:hypothetical protein
MLQQKLQNLALLGNNLKKICKKYENGQKISVGPYEKKI